MKTIPTETTACAGKEPFALMVLGDDMAPEFLDGMVITIDPGYPLVSGAYAVIKTHNDLYFRQFMKKADLSYLYALKDTVVDIPLDGAWELKGVVVQSSLRRRICHYDYVDGQVKTYVKLRGRQSKKTQ